MKSKNIIIGMLILSLFILPIVSAKQTISLEEGWNEISFKHDVAWEDLKFTDGEIILSIVDASNATNQWVSATLQYWNTANNRFDFISSLNIGRYKNTISAKEKVFVYSNQEGISILQPKKHKTN